MKNIILWFIQFYKKNEPIRLEIGRQLQLAPSDCKFQPTCSEYTYQAVEKYGVLKGITLGIKRIVRCNPSSVGGYDPVK